MKLKMAQNSLFAILLRSRWWVSFLLAAAAALVARLVLPKEYEALAVFSGAPFIVIGAIAAWKQFRQPSPRLVQETIRSVSAMSWPAFADALEKSFRADGHAVARLTEPGADFELTRDGRLALVAARRWKAARTGIEPVRELHAVMVRRGATTGIYLALGEPSDAAMAHAREHAIEIVGGEGLAMLIRRAS
ncbi:MAG TPA: restriction endonuclease [Albitalea sp.]|uniref:restriction endonuclease n=1 Tax=Piscinibacter sp. TaxID=1903157 RepID=UPI002ED04BA6